MTVDNERIKIIEKISAILAKANSTTFDEEADTARKLAAKLIANYEIKNHELDSAEKIEVVNIPSDNSCRKNMKHAICYSILAQYCGVFMVTIGTNYRLIGKRKDIDAAIYMMSVIWSQVENMTENWYKINKKIIGVTAKHKNSYQHGLVNGVHYNLDKINKGVFEYKREAGLVPVNQNVMNMKKAEDWYITKNRVRTNTTKINVNSAYSIGIKDSENISMR